MCNCGGFWGDFQRFFSRFGIRNFRLFGNLRMSTLEGFNGEMKKKASRTAGMQILERNKNILHP